MDKRKLERGELTRIIIGIVMGTEEGVRAKDLSEKLKKSGIEFSQQAAGARLAGLAKDGRIRRREPGLYCGD